MRWLVVLALAAAACGEVDVRNGAGVPATYKQVAHSAGHTKHVGKVPCEDCHGDTFKPPSPEVCTKCHAEVRTPLHPPDPTSDVRRPVCTECHAFREKSAVEPWNCVRCHDKLGAHADEKCADCHQPHSSPPTKPRACAECHQDRVTEHAGLRGCRDCHKMHEPAAPQCTDCHSKQLGKLHVDRRAIGAGHTACTTCHAPHDFKPKTCATCHAGKAELPRHECLTCHDQHDASAPPKPCASCHHEKVDHPDPTHGNPAGSCVGCHPPHGEKTAQLTVQRPALACATCHAEPPHATAQCSQCHTGHSAKPKLDQALCSRCHPAQVQRAAGTGHGLCVLCHAKAAHAPAQAVPECATCHAQEAASAPKGHAQCDGCHSPHSPAPTKTCATCHAPEASNGHGPKVACTTCHRAHGPKGVVSPPACQTCHVTTKGLHKAPHHASCADCHRSHELRPRDDRATCTACHKDRVNHEPTAQRCATCHPFR
jgi:predicted CXXCH cytochrome family protein